MTFFLSSVALETTVTKTIKR